MMIIFSVSRSLYVYNNIVGFLLLLLLFFLLSFFYYRVDFNNSPRLCESVIIIIIIISIFLSIPPLSLPLLSSIAFKLTRRRRRRSRSHYYCISCVLYMCILSYYRLTPLSSLSLSLFHQHLLYVIYGLIFLCFTDDADYYY